MNELGGHPYFLINFFFYYYKRRSNLNFRATKGIVYIYDKYFVVTLKLTNYADNTSLISLPASFFVIFRGKTCIGAKYRQSTGLPCNGFTTKKILPANRESALNLTVFFLLLVFEAAAESLKER